MKKLTTPTLSDHDLDLFSEGVHYTIYEKMGGRLTEEGASFSVWAPKAKDVFTVLENETRHQMTKLGPNGVYYCFIPGVKEGDLYEFDIVQNNGNTIRKSDPFALSAELRPKRASKLAHTKNFKWGDQAWMDQRKKTTPLLIYELHLGSWRGEKNYRELAHELADYVLDMGFTHIELLPITEHPLDESWGYQVSGYFAATSRFGTPNDFQYFVNHLHKKGIGVILDWVPGHFPADDFALSLFDGTPLFEHEEQGLHPHWETHLFDYRKKEVVNFLVASALFWLDHMHIDGLRVDAVSSMLRLDYGRKKGEWRPNKTGGYENLEAIEFLKKLNVVVHQRFPNAWMIAEEAGTFPNVTKSVNRGGLGFDLKWNLGWMNDTLRYFSKKEEKRCEHHEDLTFTPTYLWTEKFLLPLSHDEVVHLKKSLFSKMPQKPHENVQLLYSYMICFPGAKLLFMGGEFGQKREWDSLGCLDWEILEDHAHLHTKNLVKELNYFYRSHPALYADDFSPRGFEWNDCSDRERSVISYYRKGGGEMLLCVHNFSSNEYNQEYVQYRKVFDTQPGESLSPYSTQIFQLESPCHE